MGKLFGPSFKELADKEFELRKRIKENGEITTVHIPAKRKLSLYEKYFIIFSSIFLSIVLIIALSVIYHNATIPAADYDGFKSTMLTYINDNGSISDIIIKERDMFKVIVKDDWYNSGEIEKIRFCNSVRDVIYVFAYQYNLIYEDNDYIYLSFYDTTGIEVAEQDMGEYNILH